MKTKQLYLLIAILGTVIPYYHFINFFIESGFNIGLFLAYMFDTPISSFFAWDVILSTLAMITLIMTEGRRLRMSRLWLYVLFNLTVGVSLALPAFFYAREVCLERSKK